MELAPRKIIIFLILLVVLFLVFQTILNISKTTNSGLDEIEEKTCQENPILLNNKYYNCNLDSSICNDREKEEWEKAISYLGEKAELGCDKLAKDDDKENDCSCLQNLIWKELNPKSSQSSSSSTYVGKLNTELNFNSKTELEKFKSCTAIKGKFNPDNIYGTPYWVTLIGETGKNNFNDRLSQVVTDTKGTKSYGNFGLNSKGEAVTFWNTYASNLGLKGIPGTIEADDSWKEVSESKPTELILAQIDWYNKNIIMVVRNSMKSKNFPEEIQNNPKIIAYLSDVTIQIGTSLMDSLLTNIIPENEESPDDYLLRLAVYQSSDKYLKKRFKTYLSEHPERIKGLKNRITEVRLPLSQKVTIVALSKDLTIKCET